MAFPQTLARFRAHVGRRNLAAVVRRWIATARQRRDLARLDDRQLADIGLTRADERNEAHKAFWR